MQNLKIKPGFIRTMCLLGFAIAIIQLYEVIMLRYILNLLYIPIFTKLERFKLKVNEMSLFF